MEFLYEFCFICGTIFIQNKSEVKAMVNHQHYGYFFFPSTPNNKINGVITINKNKDISFQFLAGRNELENFFSLVNAEDISNQFTLFGCLHSGQHVSLINSYGTNRSRFFNSTIEVIDDCYFTEFVKGLHIKNIDEIEIKQFYFHCTSIDTWMFKNITFTEPITDDDCKRELIKIICPEWDKIEIQEGFYIALWGQQIKSNPNRSSFNFCDRTCVTFLFTEPKTLSEIRRKQLIFLWLLNFATNKQQGILENYIYINENRVDIISNFCKPSNDFIEPQLHEMLFNYRDIENIWSASIKNWFEKIEPYFTQYAWYFMLKMSSSNFIEQDIIHLTQFLEGYHRINYPLTKEDEKTRKDKIKKIIKDNIPNAEDRSMLYEKLAHAHEPSFKERIVELMDNCALCGEILEGENKDAFSKEVKDTRDFYTHLFARENNVEVDWLKIRRKLNKLAQYYLLRELLLPEEECKNIMERYYGKRK